MGLLFSCKGGPPNTYANSFFFYYLEPGPPPPFLAGLFLPLEGKWFCFAGVFGIFYWAFPKFFVLKVKRKEDYHKANCYSLGKFLGENNPSVFVNYI